MDILEKSFLLNNEFELSVLDECTYAYLWELHRDIEKVVRAIKNAIEKARWDGKLTLASRLTVKLAYARQNQRAVEVVMMNKEADMCEFGDIETIWLN